MRCSEPARLSRPLLSCLRLSPAAPVAELGVIRRVERMSQPPKLQTSNL